MDSDLLASFLNEISAVCERYGVTLSACSCCDVELARDESTGRVLVSGLSFPLSVVRGERGLTWKV